ncbi:hypothetical protein COT66_00405 [Candidatus Shapirobacteria bacterium CG09_land_8_20_14_0_10_49_15]|uniref:Glycosyltransferase 2-like domain-containing protein n=2 Tax=Candidatus Shapironibacteriota TaxID=1752721 RepID=A0A2M8L6Y9_9BACT|nr:MAG: hypothetical protein COT66_00405 [Candidatus Shapirobacteria bacterium CG09_land_8_20_14_0_10_49_15]PJE70014.1 MAG: hypothetical protein COU97_01990 [Candidatus Shapirobacteria bacterium CG10_big_fil_rev_8_21_14_0_10_48_15]
MGGARLAGGIQEKMKRLSVALATFNEAENLPACLDSIKGWAAEIVIVDGGSSDQTRQIAQQYGAKVIKTTNPPLFHINKQKAIDACTGEWILQLDADERVSLALKKEILKTINQPSISHQSATNQPINGFWLPRKNFFLGRFLTKGGQYPDYTLRLYRRGKGRLPCQSVHEQAVVDGQTGYLKNDLLHMADPNFRRYLKRFGRYTDLLAGELSQQKLKINLINSVKYLFGKPLVWFASTYVGHKGFVDGWAGFVFSFFSALRFAVSYVKYWQHQK